MKVLAIGNSFSTDATRYLHQIAAADNYDLSVVNLYIGGCPLSLHYKNILTDAKSYLLEFNGESTGFNVSIQDALLAQDWDCVTLQQVSHLSVNYETYQPYLDEIVKYTKKYSPKTKIVIHQTWAYEQNGEKLLGLGYADCLNMSIDIKNAYRRAAKDVKAEKIIPSGELFQKLIGAGIKKLHRDGFHATFGLGRYALGLLWYTYLTGRSVAENSFSDFDEPVDTQDAEIVRKCVEDLREIAKTIYSV